MTASPVMSKYLVTIAFELDVIIIYQYYMVTKEERNILKNLCYHVEGACCSQHGCFDCTVGGYYVVFDSAVKVKPEEEKILERICSHQIKSQSELLDICAENYD